MFIEVCKNLLTNIGFEYCGMEKLLLDGNVVIDYVFDYIDYDKLYSQGVYKFYKLEECLKYDIKEIFEGTGCKYVFYTNNENLVIREINS